jgi:hypothetical protein
MECLLNILIPQCFQIDHRNNKEIANNAFSNLQILTIKEHAQKTADDNPERGQKAGKKSSYPILRYRKDKNNEMFDEMRFDSMNDATRRTGATQKRIMRSINNGVADSEEYYWLKADDDEDLPDEEFRQLPGCREGMLVSNKGRVCFAYRPNPYKTYGSPTAEGYLTFSCDERTIRVHRAVMLAFVGPPPVEEGYTVDHRDGNKTNNCVENLRWATPEQQQANTSNVRRIELYDTENPGKPIKIFNTEAELVAEDGRNQTSVSEAVLFQTNVKERTRDGAPRVTIHIKRGTTLSARYADMTNEEKMKREMDILDHLIRTALQDKNKRKSNPDNLPIGVTRGSQGGLRASMKFLGKEFREGGGKDPQALAHARRVWFDEVVEKRRAFIRASFGYPPSSGDGASSVPSSSDGSYDDHPPRQDPPH